MTIEGNKAISQITIMVPCYICGKNYLIDTVTEIIWEGEEMSHYLCSNCLRDLLWELRPTIAEAIEKLRKVIQNPSER